MSWILVLYFAIITIRYMVRPIVRSHREVKQSEARLAVSRAKLAAAERELDKQVAEAEKNVAMRRVYETHSALYVAFGGPDRKHGKRALLS